MVYNILSNEDISLLRAIRVENDPRGVAVDDKGNVFVASCYGDDISMYDINGKFVSRLLEKLLDCPWGVWWDESTGHLYVADSGNKAVKVVDYA